MSKYFVSNEYESIKEVVSEMLNTKSFDVYIQADKQDDDVFLSLKHRMKDVTNVGKLQLGIIDFIESTNVFKNMKKSIYFQIEKKDIEIKELKSKLADLEKFKTHYDLEYALRHGPTEAEEYVVK